MGKMITFFVGLLCAAFLGETLPGLAQGYQLDKGDLITVTFWQQPDLNTQARIDNEGKIDLPLVGRLDAANLTVEQLSRRIVEKMSIYNSRITQATVKIDEYGSRKIFVTGAVRTPGKYTFEKIPNIWEAILEAGGPLPNAQLDIVQIVRGGESAGQVIEVDLTAAFTGGDLSQLPKLEPGDNVNVPAVAGPQAAGGPLQGNLVSGSNALYIFGYVVTPGVYRWERNMDVLQAIIQAGGPLIHQGNVGGGRLSRDPDLRNVKIISRGPDGPVVYSINVEEYTKHAAPIPLPLRPGDTIYVPGREDYGRFVMTNTIVEVLRTSIAIVTSYLLLNELFNQGNN